CELRCVWIGAIAGWCLFVYFFFFQAEDGIRDKLVTGVQTCALPISAAPDRGGLWNDGVGREPAREAIRRDAQAHETDGVDGQERSEERRVGKECRAGGAPEHEKKKRKENSAGGGDTQVQRKSEYKMK